MSGLSFLVGQLAALLVAAAILGAVVALLAARLVAGRRAPTAPAPVDPRQLVAFEQQLSASRAENDRLRRSLADASDRSEAEMGRLETGAIHALETTIAKHRERTELLEADLVRHREALRESEGRLAEERMRTDRLTAALADRDALISQLQAPPGGGTKSQSITPGTAR